MKTIVGIAAIGISLASFGYVENVKPHPRLFIDDAGFAELKERAKTDEMLKGGVVLLKRQVGRMMKAKLPKYGLTDGKRMLATSHDVEEAVLTMAMLYRLEGNTSYLNRAEELMVVASEFPDWHPGHFLDVGVMAFGVGTAYDWLYSDLRPEAREKIAAGLIRNGVGAGLKYPRRIGKGINNWGQVCPGGVLVSALATAETAPDKCEKIIELVKEGLPITMAMYKPNGSYPEGPGYWGFGTMYNILAIETLRNVIGTDFGMMNLPGFRETGYYRDIVTGTSGRTYNYSDCGAAIRGSSWMIWWFAKRFNDPGIVEPYERAAYQRMLAEKSDKVFFNPLYLLYVFPKPDDAKVNIPLVWRSEGRTDIAVLRSSWNKDAKFAAFKGGKACSPHSHMDIGSFIYDAKEERWACDLGGENYAKGEHAIGDGAFWGMHDGSKRFDVFRYSMKAHNMLILDGAKQPVTAEVRVSRISEKPMMAELNLTPVYTNASEVIRRGELTDNGLRITDSIRGLRDGATILWNMLTPANVVANGDKLELSLNGKTLVISREVPSGASAWTIEKGPHGDDWESKNRDMTRIYFTVPSSAAGTKLVVNLE